MFSQKIGFLCISFFIKLACLGQMLFGEGIVQNPLLQVAASFYPVLKKPIKSFLYLIDKDTISKSYYSKAGNEETKFDYEKNKPLYKSTHKYVGNLKTETAFFINNLLASTTTYRYDKNNHPIEWQRIKMVYDKKTTVPQQLTDVHWIIEYDANKKVKKKFSVDASHQRNLVYEYFYDASKNLIETNQAQWKDTYDYQNDLLVKKIRIFKPNNSISASSEYQYNNTDLLIASSDNYHTYEYSYNAAQLAKITRQSKRDSAYQTITFQYADRLLSKAVIITTDVNLLPEFTFKTDYLYFAWDRREANMLDMEFLYDKYQNIIEIKYFIKGIYKYSKHFIYTYY